MRKKGLFWLFLALLVVLFLAAFLEGFGSLSYAQEESALAKIQKRKVIKIGWATYPPYHDRDLQSKLHVGAAVDVGEELGKFMDVKVEWVEDSWATLIAGLYAGKYDLIIPMDRTRERYMAAGFTDWLGYSAEVLATKKTDAKRIKHFRDANKPGIRISVSLGTASDVVITEQLNKAEIVRVASAPVALLQLVSGKVDAWASSTETVSRGIREYPGLRIADGNMKSKTNGFVTRPEDQVFINFLNFFIKEIRTDGTLKKIWKKWGMPEYLVEPEWKQPQ